MTLVGKGVCFDTGGLDLKPSSNMLLMKKDMGGAAVMLALARCVMALDLPVRLRLLVPAVENSIGGAAFRPGDVITMRSGTTVEVTNTDAEGRLILADALAEADGEEPALLLDAATLTGAARVAVGPELPAMFTPDDALAALLVDQGRATFDPLWRLPLHAPYLGYMKSQVADLANAPASRSRVRSPRRCSSRNSSARPRLGRISTCSPGTTMPAPAGRAAARRPACARFWPQSSSTSPGAAEPMTRAAARRAAASIRTCSRSRPAGWTTTSSGT